VPRLPDLLIEGQRSDHDVLRAVYLVSPAGVLELLLYLHFSSISL
jgi:hypothetical protein